MEDASILVQMTLTLIVLAAIIVFVVFALRYGRRVNAERHQRIFVNGVRGLATVRSVHQRELHSEGAPQIDFECDVIPEGGGLEPFRGVTRPYVAATVSVSSLVGTTLPVRIDPATPTDFYFVDHDALRYPGVRRGLAQG